MGGTGGLEGFPDDYPYEGDSYLEGNNENLHGYVDGDVLVTGDFAMKDNDSQITHDVSVGGNFAMHSWTTVGGNICAGGSVTLKAHAGLPGGLYVQLDDGEDAKTEFQGHAQTGDILVATTSSSASATITQKANDVCGDIYIGTGIVLTTSFKGASTHGTIHYDWDGATPAPPDCRE